MSKQSSAWMPLYIGDYLGDTQRLTTEQHGAYLLLILDYWRNGPAPDDDAVLQQITKLERAAWKKHRPALARLFQIADGEWRHKRIDKELASAADNAERRSSKAKAAAQARWGDATSNAPSMPEAMLGECPPPSPKKKSSEACASANDEPEKPVLIDPEKVMFESGRALLTEAAVPPAKQGPLLGKWKRDYGAAAVIVALGKAQREGAIDPVSFIEGCLRNGGHNGNGTQNRRADTDYRDPLLGEYLARHGSVGRHDHG
jgi:uncharacterized protein YdaU (DUF1376 family)